MTLFELETRFNPKFNNRVTWVWILKQILILFIKLYSLNITFSQRLWILILSLVLHNSLIKLIKWMNPIRPPSLHYVNTLSFKK